MKQLCLILAISLLSNYLFSQKLGDSVIVYVENRVELNIAVPDYVDLKNSDAVIGAIERFQRMVPDIQDRLSTNSADLVKFTVEGSLTIEPGDPKYTYLIEGAAVRNTGFRDQATIIGDGFKVLITTTDLSKIADLSLVKCLEEVTELLPEKTNMSKSLYYQCLDQEVSALEHLNHSNGKLDFIELNLGAGAGLIKSNWVADITFAVGLGIVNKGATKYNPYLSSNLIFEFNESGNIDLDMFLNLGYRLNIIKDPKKTDFLSVDVGYLILNQGGLFKDTTFKLGVNWSPVKGVFVSPQLYATDNFKTVFPGIRIGLGI